MRSPLLRFAATATLVVIPLAACGGGGSTATKSGPGVNVHALDSLKFDKGTYDATAGDVTLTLLNDGSIQHTLDIDGKSGFELDVAGHGDSQSKTINLTAGTYTIYCSIAGHRNAGMQATLNVK